MQKDLKIGLALGLTLVTGSVVWLATRPGLQPEARMMPPGDTDTRQQSPEKPAGPAIARFPSPDSYAGQSDNSNASTIKISSNSTETGYENEIICLKWQQTGGSLSRELESDRKTPVCCKGAPKVFTGQIYP